MYDIFLKIISYLTILYLLVIALEKSVSKFSHITTELFTEIPKTNTFFLFKNNVLTSESLEVPATSDGDPFSGPSSFPFPFSGFFWSFPVSGISAFPFSGISSTPVSFSGFTSGLSSVYFFSSKQFRGKGQKTHKVRLFFSWKKQQATGKQTYPNHQYIDTM